MQILVLSCPTGGGHNTCARYISEEFKTHHIACHVENYLNIIGKKTSDIVEKIYLDSTKGNGLVFKNAYKLGELYDKSHITSPVYLFNAFFKDKLSDYIEKNHYDLVICTHLFPSMALTEINKQKRIPFINVATDYECIPFWDETKPDYFVIPSAKLKESFVSKGFKEEMLLPLGIPIASNFYHHTHHVSLPHNEKIVLVTSGSMGFGNMLNLINKLLLNFQNIYFVVVCGNNQKVEQELKKINNPHLKVVGYTKYMNEFIMESDIVLTKPGGLTTTEVVTLNKPLIHIMPIPGVENYNANFFANNEMSMQAQNIDEVISKLNILLNDESLQKRMIANQKRLMNHTSAKSLVNFVEKTYKKERI